MHVLIGDVAGHGPDEAALGAALRIAWRTLTFAGIHGVELMRQLERMLHAERTESGIFATVLSLAIRARTARRITAIRAGHPGMLLQGAGTVEWIEPPAGPALGLNYDRLAAARAGIAGGPRTAACSPTDSSRDIRGRGNERLGEDGLLALARSLATLPGPAFVDALIDGAQELAQPRGGLTDDIAVVRVERTTA